MKPLIVDPKAYDKYDATNLTRTYISEFLNSNKIFEPKDVIYENAENKKGLWTAYGWYNFKTRTVYVNVKKTRPQTITPGFAWSFTGFKADMTAPGVLAHEFGHHVHNMLIGIHGNSTLLKAIRKVKKNELPVSGYEPNSYETFAEAIRLFILNPNLLRLGRPIRWAFLTQGLGLKPLHDISWQEILVHAHPKIISSAEKWILK
jgi:hypothetical protein